MDWQATFRLAAEMVTAASLRLPAAAPLIPLFWAAVSDPDTMVRVGEAWGDNTPGPRKAAGPFVTKPEPVEWRPPMAVQDDIALLRADLRSLLAAAESKEDWKGGSFTAFKKLAQEFDSELEHLGELRKGMKGSMLSGSNVFKTYALVLLAIATFVVALAVFATAMSITPQTAVAAQVQANTQASKLYNIVSTLVRTVAKLTFRLTLLMGGIGYAAAGMSAKFPGMQAVKGESPNFTKAQAVWDQQELTIKKAPDLGLPDKKIGGSFSNLIPGLS
ncbi:hypothetical protein GCM10010404_56170 [Nonomuraea africana]|uniref:WXG100 family type VII secretion target n=1 Tax=Nonomuraea africana TaxID=46171 RepID=A0ABR9KUB9_9ACTN|nr:hypothetical protein [Nonomuraea africana]MBE1565625.1 hypothetical protein [Nonomuraea africana]